MPKHIIFDTHPGIDDSLAILLAPASPELTLEGISVVHGNSSAAQGVVNALSVLELANAFHIPVYKGCDLPLVQPSLLAPETHGDRGLGYATLKQPGTRPQTRLGSDFLIEHARREQVLVATQVDQLRIKTPHLDQPVAHLSGGNQQKVVLAKWLARGCEAIILDEPTRGIDVGAKFEMYTLINELSGQGKAVVLISSDLPELMSMSDRLYVMHQGDVVAEVDARRTSQEEVMHFASGYFEHAAA